VLGVAGVADAVVFEGLGAALVGVAVAVPGTLVPAPFLALARVLVVPAVAFAIVPKGQHARLARLGIRGTSTAGFDAGVAALHETVVAAAVVEVIVTRLTRNWAVASRSEYEGMCDDKTCEIVHRNASFEV